MKKSALAKLKSINFLQNYRKIWPYVKPYKFRAMLAVFLTLPMGLMDASIALLLKPYMDAVMVNRSAAANTIMPVIIVGVSVFQSLLNYASTYFNSWVGQKITMDLRMSLFAKLIRNEVNFFDKKTSGEVQLRYNADADAACNGLLNNIKTVTTQVFSSIALIGVLFWNSWQLAIVAIVAMGFALYPASQVRKKIAGMVKQTVTFGAGISTSYNEAFSGNRVITSYNLYDYQKIRFKNTLHTLFNLGMKMTKRTGILSPLMHFIVSLGIAGVVWLGGHLIVTNQLTPGGFVSFISALLMLYTPVKGLGNNITALQISFMSMERVFEMLEREPAIKNQLNATTLNDIKQGITYKDVVFEYTKDTPVLKGVSLHIKKGQTIALVGNSGGGKTTFVNLLPRFYDVTSGSICIDGVDIKNIELDSLRDKIAIVFQDNILFAGTIRENILLGRTDITEDRLQVVLKNACLDEFILSLEKGLDTEIGERGVLLSGGQKQRIAIARAFIKDAPIVILDEATSALDNKSEAVVQTAIHNLMRDRTVFIIAHRLSTVRNADSIVVINYGEIVEQGTHDELIVQEGSVYGMLYNTSLK